jgi:hypothetical protein
MSELTYHIPLGTPVRICPHCGCQYVTVQGRQINLDKSDTPDGMTELYGPAHTCQEMLAQRQKVIEEQPKSQ